MTESLITLLGQLLHFQNGFKGAELPARFLDGLQSGSWPHQLLDTWSATTAFFVAGEECGGCTPEPLPFRRSFCRFGVMGKLLLALSLPDLQMKL